MLERMDPSDVLTLAEGLSAFRAAATGHLGAAMESAPLESGRSPDRSRPDRSHVADSS